MKFLLPGDLQKFRYYAELLSEIHGRIELKRLSFTKNWKKKNKIKFREDFNQLIKNKGESLPYTWIKPLKNIKE